MPSIETALATSDNETDETSTNGSDDANGSSGDMEGKTGPSDHLAGKRVIGAPFKDGNQLWRKRKPPGLQTSRRALREALHEALTPDRMRDAVNRMLLIVHGKDNKASVQAFKVLAEAAGVRGDSDSARSGPSFTFVLPGAGIIPERQVENTAGNADIVDSRERLSPSIDVQEV